jgi:hypothetical protein
LIRTLRSVIAGHTFIFENRNLEAIVINFIGEENSGWFLEAQESGSKHAICHITIVLMK